MKKGQISYFLLIALILLISSSFVFYVNDLEPKKSKEKAEFEVASLDLASPIRNYVNLCLKKTGEDALYFIGLQGGFFKEQAYKVDSKGFFSEFAHTIYIQNDKNVMPSLQTIEKELSKFVDNNLQYCINDFETFRNLGYEIKSNEFSTATSITKNSVAFNLNFPITILKGQNVATMEKFSMEIPSRLDLIYNLANEVTEDQLSHLNSICISCLIELGDTNNLYFELFPRETNITIVTVEDNQTKLNNEPYLFAFAFNHSITSS